MMASCLRLFVFSRRFSLSLKDIFSTDGLNVLMDAILGNFSSEFEFMVGVGNILEVVKNLGFFLRKLF